MKRLLGAIVDEGSLGWKLESLTVVHQSINMVVHERPPRFLWIRYGSAGKIFFQSAVMNWRNCNDAVVQWKVILQSMVVDDVQKMVVLQTQNNPFLTNQIFLLSSSHCPFLFSQKCQKVLLNLIFFSLFYSSKPPAIKASSFFSPSSSKKSPISLRISFPINSPPHSPCKLTISSFQLASPPSIHMDSWWAACYSSQSPKWTQNTTQDRSGVYGHDPYGIWAPFS